MVQTCAGPVYTASVFEFIETPASLFLQGFDSPWLLLTSASSSLRFPEPRGKGFERDIPFRAECSAVP